MLQMSNVIKGMNNYFTAHLAVKCLSVCSYPVQSKLMFTYKNPNVYKVKKAGSKFNIFYLQLPPPLMLLSLTD